MYQKIRKLKKPQSFDSNSKIINIAIFGDYSIGKTSLIWRYVYDEFEKSIQSTIE